MARPSNLRALSSSSTVLRAGKAPRAVLLLHEQAEEADAKFQNRYACYFEKCTCIPKCCHHIVKSLYNIVSDPDERTAMRMLLDVGLLSFPPLGYDEIILPET